ncbi:MAG: nucleotide exchange factor GrpE [Treponema sp.]|nr:nucleotide exchange factor GrpE [Treponema sp.]
MNESSKVGDNPAGMEGEALFGGAANGPEEVRQKAQDCTEGGINNNSAGTEVKNGAETTVSEEAAEARDSAEKPLTTEEKIAELEAKLAEASDNYLRKAADFENFRKRMNQEKSNAIEYANQTLLLDLASVIDDFERAIKSAETLKETANGDKDKITAAYNSLYEGISLIEKNLLSQLENKWGLKRFDSAGEPFDPNRHEAIMMEKSAELEEPVVAEEFVKGYLLKERVIRPAKVKVVMPEK